MYRVVSNCADEKPATSANASGARSDSGFRPVAAMKRCRAPGKPWVSSGTLTLAAGTEIGEFFCVPSQEEEYRRLVRAPAGGQPRR